MISFIEGKKAVQTCLALREKVVAPKSINWLCHPLQQHFNQVFVITDYESFTLLWRSFDPLFFTEVL